MASSKDKEAKAPVQPPMSPQERLETEMAAINLLQQVGVQFSMPLLGKEIERIKRRTGRFGWFYRLFTPPLPNCISHKTSIVPSPENPDQKIEYWEAEVSIRPLTLATIDALRSIRIELQQKDTKFEEEFTSENTSPHLLQYTHEICNALAIVTLGQDLSQAKSLQRKRISEFYRHHLTPMRLLKLSQIIFALMDARSFHASTRLILAAGTTMPNGANRVEQQA